MKRPISGWVASYVILAMLGILVCYLLGKGSRGESILGLCGPAKHLVTSDSGSDAASGCDYVLTSDWANILGIPLWRIGFVFYMSAVVAGLVVVLLYDTEASHVPRQRVWQYITAYSCAAAIFSAGLVVVQAAVLGQFCPLCLTSALITWAMSAVCFIELGTLLRKVPAQTQTSSRHSMYGMIAPALIGTCLGFLAIGGLTAWVVLPWSENRTMAMRADEQENADWKEFKKSLEARGQAGIKVGDASQNIEIPGVQDLSGEAKALAAFKQYLQAQDALESRMFDMLIKAEAEAQSISTEQLATQLLEVNAAGQAESPAEQERRVSAWVSQMRIKHRARTWLPVPDVGGSDFRWDESITLWKPTDQSASVVRVLVLTDFTCGNCTQLSAWLEQLRDELRQGGSATKHELFYVGYVPALAGGSTGGGERDVELSTRLMAVARVLYLRHGELTPQNARLLFELGTQADQGQYERQMQAWGISKSDISETADAMAWTRHGLQKSAAMGVSAVPVIFINGKLLPEPISRSVLIEAIKSAAQAMPKR